MATKKLPVSSEDNRATLLLNKIMTKYGVSLERISEKTGFALTYIKKQMAPGVIPNGSFLQAVRAVYDVDEMERSAQPISSSAPLSIRGGTFMQRSVLWFVSVALPRFTASDCRIIHDIVELCYDRNQSRARVTPYAAWAKENGVAHSGKVTPTNAFQAAKEKCLPEYMCYCAAFLAEISADNIRCKYPPHAITQEQADTFALLQSHIRKIDDEHLEQIFNVAWSSEKSQRKDIPSKKSTDVIVTNTDRRVTPFFRYLCYLLSNKWDSDFASYGDIAKDLGLGRYTIVLMMQGKNDISPQILQMFFDVYAMTPLQKEIARFLAVYSRRFYAFDLLRAEMSVRVMVTMVAQSFSYLSDDQICQISSICLSAMEHADAISAGEGS